MRFRMLLTVAGALSVAFGLGFLFAPTPALQQYGVATDAAGRFLAQFFGAALLQLGLILFLVRGVQDPAIVRAIALGGCIGELAGLWIAIRVQLGGAVNAMGWSTVILYGLFALGFARFAFGKPSAP